VVEGWVRAACARIRPLRALLLGVTPELATMHWPEDTELTAVDQSAEMIEAIWPRRKRTARAEVVRATWQSMPLADSSVDVVLGDGCFTTLEAVDDYRAVTREVHRVLGPRGEFIHRFFVAPPKRDPLPNVLADLRSARIRGFHAFKWRLAAAVQERFESGVRLGDIWDVWHAEISERGPPPVALGWSHETISTIDAYRGSNARYTFPTLDEVRRSFASSFVEAACHTPTYELGERCPILRLLAQRRG
jgi:SAM-dependent methyltransferase